ncbi:MAG: hypothetical protein KKH98_10150 [Spirochaetes bacterium]|nr:hypothetical protein [Spirochaetota bacterium]
MKKFIIIFLIVFIPLSLQAEIIRLIDIPTASTILRGYYNIDFLTYGGGGIQVRLAIGLTDRIMLGIIEDVGGAIGTEKTDWNIPGVMAKINIIYPDSESMGLAIGYDSLLNGEYGKVYNNQISDDLVYGFYIALSKAIVLFSGEQFMHLGIRFPVLPNEARENGDNISLYTGLNIIFTPELMLMGELENFYLNKNRNKEIIYNAGLKYAFSEFLNIGLYFQYTSSREINPTDRPSRSLCIEYQNIFY